MKFKLLKFFVVSLHFMILALVVSDVIASFSEANMEKFFDYKWFYILIPRRGTF